jgi:hypothetical protein
MSEAQTEKKDLGQTLLNEIIPPNEDDSHKKSFWKSISIPALAILTGLLIGAVMIAATSATVWAAFGESIWKGLGTAFSEIWVAYQALFTGAIGDPVRIVRALGSGDAKEIRSALNPFLESLVQSTPYIFTGLAVVGALCLIKPLVVEPIIVQRDLPMLIVAGVLLQMFITTGRRFVRLEAIVMIAIYALFLAAQFMGFSISLD